MGTWVAVDNYEDRTTTVVYRIDLRSLFSIVLKGSLMASWAPFVGNCDISGKCYMSSWDFLFLGICLASEHRIWLVACIFLYQSALCGFALKDSGSKTRLPRSISPSSTEMSSHRPGQYGFSVGQFSSFYWANLVYPDGIEAVRFHLLQFLLWTLPF